MFVVVFAVYEYTNLSKMIMNQKYEITCVTYIIILLFIGKEFYVTVFLFLIHKSLNLFKLCYSKSELMKSDDDEIWIFFKNNCVLANK